MRALRRTRRAASSRVARSRDSRPPVLAGAVDALIELSPHRDDQGVGAVRIIRPVDRPTLQAHDLADLEVFTDDLLEAVEAVLADVLRVDRNVAERILRRAQNQRTALFQDATHFAAHGVIIDMLDG